MGDAWRWLFGIAGGFADRGPSSFDISISQADESETYTDASSEIMRSFGGEVCYYYERTWGVVISQWSNYSEVSTQTRMACCTTFRRQRVAQRDGPASWNLEVVRRIAMNFALLRVLRRQSRTYALDEKYQDGKSWGVYMQYLW